MKPEDEEILVPNKTFQDSQVGYINMMCLGKSRTRSQILLLIKAVLADAHRKRFFLSTNLTPSAFTSLCK